MTRAYDRHGKDKVQTTVFRITSDLSKAERDMFDKHGWYPWTMSIRIVTRRPNYSRMIWGGHVPGDNGSYVVKYVVITHPLLAPRIAFGLERRGHLFFGWLDTPSTCRSCYDNQHDPLLRKVHKFLSRDECKRWNEFTSGGELCA